MADRMLDLLGRMLDEYDGRRRGDMEREQKTRDDDALFLSRFAELRRSVIRPVFESAGALLEARGHRFSISEQEFTSGGEGRMSEAGISLRIVASGTRAPLHDDQRALTITTWHYNKTVRINASESPSSGGTPGAKGGYPLDKVDRQLIEDELVSFVARMVAA
jgi:hypothetical protein